MKDSSNGCKGCIFYRDLGGQDERLMACHYCYDTGCARRCPPENCAKKILRKRRKMHV